MHCARRLAVLAALLSACGAQTDPALPALDQTSDATHAWGDYHWARTANPFTVQLGDNLTSQWESYLAVASSDWSKSKVLDTAVVSGASGLRPCKPTLGRVEACNAAWGLNLWVGIATIWIDATDHIVQGTVKMNDSYFALSRYDTPEWRQFVMCQEIGHTFGLDHQDEDFYNANLGTCMDYTIDPSTNQHPNRHDYQELQIIYDHLDTTTTLAAPSSSSGSDENPSTWGRLVDGSADGRFATYVLDVGGGSRVVRFVLRD